MKKKYEKHFYNFNTREGYRNLQLSVLIRMFMMDRQDVPIGTIKSNRKYETPCRNAYVDYNMCLENNRFNRGSCEQFQSEVIACEKRENLYPNPAQIVAKLKAGLKISKQRRATIMKALKDRHEGQDIKIPNFRKLSQIDTPKSSIRARYQTQEEEGSDCFKE